MKKYRTLLIAGAAGLVLVIGGIMLSRTLVNRSDKSHFTKLATFISGYETSLKSKVGSTANSKPGQQCFYAEQSDTNKGRLWCEVSRSFTIPLTGGQSPQSVVTLIDITANDYFGKSNRNTISKGIFANDDTVTDHALFNQQNDQCELNAKYVPATTVFDVTLVCSGRAKAPHFPMR